MLITELVGAGPVIRVRTNALDPSASGGSAPATGGQGGLPDPGAPLARGGGGR